MARVIISAVLLVAVAMLVAGSAENLRKCAQVIPANQQYYLMNLCSCSIRTQLISYTDTTSNTTVVSVPAWDGTTSTKNLGTSILTHLMPCSNVHQAVLIPPSGASRCISTSSVPLQPSAVANQDRQYSVFRIRGTNSPPATPPFGVEY